MIGGGAWCLVMIHIILLLIWEAHYQSEKEVNLVKNNIMPTFFHPLF
jgi:hypothetical protein